MSRWLQRVPESFYRGSTRFLGVLQGSVRFLYGFGNVSEFLTGVLKGF